MNTRNIVICAAVIASLLAPAPVCANSLRPIAPKQSERTQAASSSPSGAQTQPSAPGQTGTASDSAPASAAAPAPDSAPDSAAAPAASVDGSNGAAGTTGTATDQPDEMMSLAGLGSMRDDLGGTPLVIPPDTPDGADDVGFLNGAWSFDQTLLASNGESVRTDFSFDATGDGIAILTDERNTRYTAKARAIVSDGILKIQTGAYTSPETSQSYRSSFIECRNSGNGVVCGGTDGFSVWDGEHVVSAMEARAGVPEKPSGVNVTPGSGAHEVSAPVEAYAELSPDGAELSPAIMESAEKAKVADGSATLSTLTGDWRYSRDLARKTDGESVSLEFHFDANGQGYSLIRDGVSEDFKAPAEIQIMPDGTIRVKTDAYTNGSDRGYYPTFMECRNKQSAELRCDVSNGWTRVNDGVLVSKESLEEQNRHISMEELLPVAPEAESSSPQAAGQASAGQSGTDAGAEIDIAGILADMSDTSAAQSAAQSAARTQHTATTKSTGQEVELSLPERDTTLSFLEGHWRCNTGLVRVSDDQPVVVEFRFDKQGKGTAIVHELSGEQYIASAQAAYRKGHLRINTSDFYSEKTQGRYNKSYIECVDQGGRALCKGKNGGITWSGASFTRLQ